MSGYASLNSMWFFVTKKLAGPQRTSQASRDGGTSEFLNYFGTLHKPQAGWVHSKRRALSPAYAAAEVLWYMSGSNEASDITAYAPQYARMAEADNKLYGAYGERLTRGHDKIATAVKMLKKDPDSRRCVVSLWDGDDISDALVYDVKDVPCTLSWQFFVREHHLSMTVTMRSQDVWLGMPYDVFWNCLVMRSVAAELKLPLGIYAHNCGSIHLYERNLEAAQQATSVTSPSVADSPQLWPDLKYEQFDNVSQLRRAADCERLMRESGAVPKEAYSSGLGEVGRSLLGLCANHLGVPHKLTIDPVLKAAEKTHADHRRMRQSR